ncbi:MAG: acyl dehydratase [Gammaproteobacteria bacterium]
MELDDQLMAFPVPVGEQEMSPRDAMLYALGIGIGSDPVDKGQLQFVYENDLKVFPSMAVVLAGPGFWLKDPGTGVDWVKVLHGEMGMILHRPIPTEGKLVGHTSIVDVIDKGENRGALILQERIVTDEAGEKICTLTSTTFARGNGGFGGPAKTAPVPHQLPEREPDGSVDLPMVPQSALIYRLSGDYNPLHADPDIAFAAGFERPILHGLCTFGVACHGLVKAVLDYDASRLKEMRLRFSAPVYPGETIRVEYWKDDNTISFRALVVERKLVVLNNGRAIVA